MPEGAPTTSADPRLARILDANLNRAREGLRVAEEIARFYVADGGLAARLKAAREGVGAWAASLGQASAIMGRDAETDPGRPLTGPRELERGSPADLVRANMKRAQEAVRVIEEVAKLAAPEAPSGRFKEMRYTLYSLETALLEGLDRASRP